MTISCRSAIELGAGVGARESGIGEALTSDSGSFVFLMVAEMG